MEVTSATTTILGVTKTDAEWKQIAAGMREAGLGMLRTLATNNKYVPFAKRVETELVFADIERQAFDKPVRTIDQEGNDVG